jgi:hypothetical protein
VSIRYLRPLTSSQLATLSLQRLNAYRNKLLALEESPELSDWDADELAALDPGLLHFKSDARWGPLHAQVMRAIAQRTSAGPGDAS